MLLNFVRRRDISGECCNAFDNEDIIIKEALNIIFEKMVKIIIWMEKMTVMAVMLVVMIMVKQN